MRAAFQGIGTVEAPAEVETMSDRYTILPYQHGWQVWDTRNSVWCDQTWHVTDDAAHADKDKLNKLYVAWIKRSEFARRKLSSFAE
jgi:hypothetical protein